MLKLEAVSKSFVNGGNRQVLAQLNFTLASREYVAIMGESGSGKSTLLNLIAGLETADSGSIELDGAQLSQLDDDDRTQLRAKQLGFVFQAFHLLPHLSVAQNVSLPLALAERAPADAESKTLDLLGAMGLAARAGSYPRELSVGEMQRVAIARALVHTPKLVLADEPTGNLDLKTAEQVLRLLHAQIKGRGIAGILVTHSLAAARTADRIYQLREGSLHPLDTGA